MADISAISTTYQTYVHVFSRVISFLETVYALFIYRYGKIGSELLLFFQTGFNLEIIVIIGCILYLLLYKNVVNKKIRVACEDQCVCCEK